MNNQPLINNSISQSVWRVWFIRHGHTSLSEEGRFSGHMNISLSPRGKEQAQWLATHLHSLIARPVTIYSSDLTRAYTTAATIAEAFGVQVTAFPAWREIDFGAFDGLTYQQVRTQYPDHLDFFTEPESYAPFDGELLTDVVQRTQDALLAILHTQPPSRDIIIVTHAGALRALLCTLLQIPLNHQWQLRIDIASFSAVDLSFDSDGTLLATLVLLNMSEKYTGKLL